jgi:HEPN domain-containing protein
MANRAFDWLRQAQNDLLWTRDTIRAERYSQACFAAQQAGEKALKALALKRGYSKVLSHSLMEIARALEINGKIEEYAKRLDLYYFCARYPDAFPAGAPFEYFTEEQALEAAGFAEFIIESVGTEFPEEKQ